MLANRCVDESLGEVWLVPAGILPLPDWGRFMWVTYQQAPSAALGCPAVKASIASLAGSNNHGLIL